MRHLFSSFGADGGAGGEGAVAVPSAGFRVDHVRRRLGRRSAAALALYVARGRLLSLGLPAAFGLAGCDRAGSGAPGSAVSGAAPSPFKSTDVTGVDYGRKLALFDASGKERTLQDFRGKVVMLFFGFTHCPDVCPSTLAKAAEAKKQLGAQGDSLQVIFVTLDPERDTAAAIETYVTAFDPTFIGLRGDPAQTQAAAREFRVFYQKVPSRDGTSYTVDHTAASYLLDQQGNLRLFVKYGQAPEDVAADVRQLLS